jgi:hypothetical protein
MHSNSLVSVLNDSTDIRYDSSPHSVYRCIGPYTTTSCSRTLVEESLCFLDPKHARKLTLHNIPGTEHDRRRGGAWRRHQKIINVCGGETIGTNRTLLIEDVMRGEKKLSPRRVPLPIQHKRGTQTSSRPPTESQGTTRPSHIIHPSNTPGRSHRPTSHSHLNVRLTRCMGSGEGGSVCVCVWGASSVAGASSSRGPRWEADEEGGIGV